MRFKAQNGYFVGACRTKGPKLLLKPKLILRVLFGGYALEMLPGVSMYHIERDPEVYGLTTISIQLKGLSFNERFPLIDPLQRTMFRSESHWCIKCCEGPGTCVPDSGVWASRDRAAAPHPAADPPRLPRKRARPRGPPRPGRADARGPGLNHDRTGEKSLLYTCQAS